MMFSEQWLNELFHAHTMKRVKSKLNAAYGVVFDALRRALDARLDLYKKNASNVSNRLRLNSPRFAIASLLISGLAVSGCGFKQSKQDAEKALIRHFQSISSNRYDVALADYGSQFFQNNTKDEWSNTLVNLTRKFGAYQSHSITNWRVFKKSGTFGSGTYVELECQATYSKHSARESFTFFKGGIEPDYKIVGHFISSQGFLKE